MSDNKQKSDDRFDALTAVLIIAVAVGAVVYWLSGFPS